MPKRTTGLYVFLEFTPTIQLRPNHNQTSSFRIYVLQYHITKLKLLHLLLENPYRLAKTACNIPKNPL